MIQIDNIEGLRKINDLTRELLKHGIAANSEEATQMAREMIDKENSYKDVIGTDNTLKPSPDSDFKEKIREVVDQKLRTNNEQIINHLSAMNSQMMEMAAEITNLKNQIIMLKQQRVEIREERQAVLSNQAPQSQPVEQKKEEPHARVGNYKPGDASIAIDKIFYAGR